MTKMNYLPFMLIGEEGKTGSAGHRHLHFSIHRNIWSYTDNDIKRYNPALPPAINFIIKGGRNLRATDLPCEDNNDLTRTSFQGKDL